MKRRFNYTGRKRIKREMITINLIRQNGRIVSFSLDCNRLKKAVASLNLPPDAKIYVEAYYRTELKRFDFGNVENITPIEPLSLKDLAYPENLKFRILVVDASDGRILAHADRLKPDEPAEKKSILPVEFKDLGNEIWHVEYGADEGAPILCINRRITNITNIAKQDSQFFMHVYPAVIREILTHMVFVDKVDSVTEPETDWHKDWLKFCENLGVPPPESLNPDDIDNFDRDEALRWIDQVITSFTDLHHHEFQEYLKKLEEVS